MVGVELRLLDGKPATDVAMQVIKTMLHRGYILLPEGEHGNVISFTAPLTISQTQLRPAVNALKDSLGEPKENRSRREPWVSHQQRNKPRPGRKKK